MTQAKPIEEKRPETVFTIIVNAERKEWREREISFEQVVKLAYGVFEDNENIVYKVTWQYADNSGSGRLVRGGKPVKVKDRMIFNVSRTDKS